MRRNSIGTADCHPIRDSFNHSCTAARTRVGLSANVSALELVQVVHSRTHGNTCHAIPQLQLTLAVPDRTVPESLQ